MERVERVFPEGIPKAIGPYSPVAAYNDLIFISGQIPVNPETGNIESQDVEKQTDQVMRNLKAALEGADSNFSLVTKCTILLTDMGDFGKVNAVYQSYFQQDRYPARVCYAVAALPKNSKVEIDAIAIRSAINDQLQKKVKQGPNDEPWQALREEGKFQGRRQGAWHWLYNINFERDLSIKMSDSHRASLCPFNPQIKTIPASSIKIQQVSGTSWVQDLHVSSKQLLPAVLSNGTLYAVGKKPQASSSCPSKL